MNDDDEDYGARLLSLCENSAPATVRAAKRVRLPDDSSMAGDVQNDGEMEEGEVTEEHLCQQCRQRQRLYCCPRCAIKTCSLACCKAHKAQTGCTGRRDRFEFCPLSQFTDDILRKDYFFLEEVINSTQAAKRKLVHAGSKSGQVSRRQKRARNGVAAPGSSSQATDAESSEARLAARAAKAFGLADDWLSRFPYHLQRLVNEAMVRGVTLLLMPEGMSKRKRNTTRLSKDQKIFFWRVEWEFCDAELGPVKLSEVAHDDRLPLAKALDRHLDPRPGNAPTRQRLKRYCRCARGDLLMFVERVVRQANRPSYYRIDPSIPLGEQLRGKVVVEFLTVHVALPSIAHRFPLLVEEVPLLTDDNEEAGSGEESEAGEEEDSDEDGDNGDGAEDDHVDEDDEVVEAGLKPPSLLRKSVHMDAKMDIDAAR